MRSMTSAQIEQIRQECRALVTDIDRLDPQTKQRIFVIATSLGSRLIGKYMSKELLVLAVKRVGVRLASKQAAKFVPFLGSALAASISYGAMRMLGNAHIEDCCKVLQTLQTDGHTFEHETTASRTQSANSMG